MLTEADLQELHNIRSGHFPDKSTRWYRRAILYLFPFILHRCLAEDHQELLHILVSADRQNMEVVNMAQSIIELSEQRGLEQGIAQGRQQGIAQGKQQGIAQGETRAKRAAVLKVIESRFERVPEPLARRINRMRSHARLDSLLDEVLQAGTIDDLHS